MANSSKAFVADLPDMSEEQLAKLYAWGQSCEQFDVHMQDGGAMTLVAVRKKCGTARDHMRLLRTNLQNWGVVLPTKQAGWLRLVDESVSAECKISQARMPANPSVPEKEGPASDAPERRANAPSGGNSATIDAQESSAIAHAPLPTINCKACSSQLKLPNNLLCGSLCLAA